MTMMTSNINHKSAPSRRSLLSSVSAILIVGPRSVSKAQETVITVPMSVDAHRIGIECHIGDRGPFCFVLDTGGIISLINLRLAQELGLRVIGQSILGMADGQASYPIFEARDVVLGEVARQASVALAGTQTIQFGDGFSGSFAAGLVTAMDAELNFDVPALRLYPSGGPVRKGWVRGSQAIQHKGLPNGSAFLFADVVLDGKRLRCGLDTGMPLPMRLTAAGSRKFDWQDHNWSPAAHKTRLVRASKLVFGDGEFERPILGIQPTRLGPSDYVDGLIGLPLIRLLNLATDVKDNFLWTKRNNQMAPATKYNMSGVWLDRIAIGGIVSEIGQGSPAEASGLLQGDHVDGDFDNLTKSLNGDVDTTITLSIRRNGAPQQVTMTLSDYL